MTPECEAKLEQIESAVKQYPEFRSGAIFRANDRADEDISDPARTVIRRSVEMRIPTRFGFTVELRATEETILADDGAIPTQLRMLALEGVSQRYLNLKGQVEKLVELMK